MGCLNLLVIHYKELRGKEHVVSALAVLRMIVESAYSVRISPSLVVLDGRRKDIYIRRNCTKLTASGTCIAQIISTQCTHSYVIHFLCDQFHR